MPIAAKIEVKNSGLITDLRSFGKELFNAIKFKLTAGVNEVIPELQKSLLDVATRLYNSSPTVTQESTVESNDSATLRFPKLKKDVIKELFGHDLDKINFRDTETKNDTISLFVARNNRIKGRQSISDSSTYSGEETRFKERLIKGIIINYENGKLNAPDPDTIKGIKLECSTDSGQTINSEHKFEAYKNSTKISRTKSDYQRAAIWTVRQADTKNILNGALSLDALVGEVIAGNYRSAAEMLKQKNKTGVYTEAIENLEKIRTGSTTNTNLANFNKLKKLIDNLQTKKYESENNMSISLVSTYDSSVEEDAVDFFNEIKKYIYLWNIDNQDKWMKDVIRAVELVIKKYNKGT